MPRETIPGIDRTQILKLHEIRTVTSSLVKWGIYKRTFISLKLCELREGLDAVGAGKLSGQYGYAK